MAQQLTDNLKQAIVTSGLSHAKLAEATGIPQPTITRFVNGADMKLSTASKLAAYFRLSLQPTRAKRK